MVDQVCLVPDAATFYEVLTTWDQATYFPILIDDVELSLKFLQAFRPARIVRYPRRGQPIGPAQAWDRAVAAVGRSWSPRGASGDALLRGDERPEKLGKTPPGVVVGRPESESLPGLAALAAGRFQPMIRLDSPKVFRDELRKEDIPAFFGGLEAALRARVPSFARLGDDCDFLTLAGDYPYKFADPKGVLAVDDIVGRGGPNAERWAYTGRLVGDARRSVYAAMCSLFLRAESALLFDGYPEHDEPKRPWALRAAAIRLAPYLAIRLVVGDPPATPATWHAAIDPVNRFGLVLINSHGLPTSFATANGALHALDVMPTAPAAVAMIHSYSAADPLDAGTIAGRWLAQGAFLYYGSMEEPQLPAFRLPGSFSADLIAAGFPDRRGPAADAPGSRSATRGRLVLLGATPSSPSGGPSRPRRGSATIRRRPSGSSTGPPTRPRPTRPSRPAWPGRSTRP